MSKFLTPWYPQTFGGDTPLQYVRLGVGGEYLEFMIWRTLKSPGVYVWYDIHNQIYDTDKAALEASDNLLIQQGYVFLTKEQVEKFQILA